MLGYNTLKMSKTIRKIRSGMDVILKRSIVKSKPLYVQIEPTGRCNLNCKMCFRQKGLGPQQDLKLDQFKKILDETQPKYINMTGYGESFMNKDLIKMIKEAKKRGITVIMSSNFTFTRKYADEIVKSGLDLIKVSLDAAEKETFKKIRGQDFFNEILKGVKALTEAKKKYNSETPQINMHCVLMRDNLTQIPSLVKLAKNLKIDCLFIKPALVGEVEKNKKILIGKMGKNEVLTFLREGEKIAKEVDLNTNLTEFIKDVDKNWENYQTGQYSEVDRCLMPFFSCFVRCNGDVHPCCVADSKRYIYGNLLEESFDKIWNNLKFQWLRRSLKKKELPYTLCKYCDMRGSFSAKTDGNLTKIAWGIIKRI